MRRRALIGVTAGAVLSGITYLAAAGTGQPAPMPRPSTTAPPVAVQPGNLPDVLDHLLDWPLVATTQIVVPLPLPVTG